MISIGTEIDREIRGYAERAVMDPRLWSPDARAGIVDHFRDYAVSVGLARPDAQTWAAGIRDRLDSHWSDLLAAGAGQAGRA